MRLAPILDPEGREFRWPDQLLVIGETGDGDYYCVDSDGEHEGVLQFRHFAVEFETIADSLEDFVELLIECFVTRTESDPATCEGNDTENPDAPEPEPETPE